jgi:hypothetical protein
LSGTNENAYQGGCHCGLIRLTYQTALDPAVWPLRHDGCSFCRKHGVVATSDPAGNVGFEFRDPARVRRYRFGTGSADFLICEACGVFVAAVTATPMGARAVINARVVIDVPLDFNRVTLASLDGESIDARHARRLRNWTPVKS